MPESSVTNGGSALGEAIGNAMEIALQQLISGFLDNYKCYFINKIGKNPLTNKYTKKLILYDEYGTQYSIDGVITNESMQPLILLESKYIKYKKHNRDKGSWICNAHTAIRKRYPSIRSSIAVLAGNWSKTSLEMIKSSGTNVFLIPFSFISTLLSEKGINFEWEEKDRESALEAWNKYNSLSNTDKMEIAFKMVGSIKDNLFEILYNVLDDSVMRTLKQVALEITTSKGEIIRKIFPNIDEAIDFLDNLVLDNLFDSSSFISIFDTPAIEE